MKKRNLTSIPYIIWMLIFILVPILLVLFFSLTDKKLYEMGQIKLTLDNFQKFYQPGYLKVLKKSIVLAVEATVICLILGYPMAYIISKQNAKKRNIMSLLFVLPMWINFLLRTYAWMTLLSKNGIINTFLKWAGLPALNIMYTDGAVLLGMVYNFLPFMILPIYSVLVKLDKDFLEASYDLGGDNIHTFRKVILPLSLPGVITGITMVFMPAVSTFAISKLLGGGKYTLIGNLVERQFLAEDNWHFGSAISIILMVMILVSMAITNKFDQDGEGGGGLW